MSRHHRRATAAVDGGGSGSGSGGVDRAPANDDDPEGPSTAMSLPWGMDKADMQEGSLASLTDEKLARFVLGQQKKTKFEKEREEREAKKRKADAEAAAIYAKFVASFEDEDDRLGKAFVRGSESSRPSHNDGDPSSDIYRLQGGGRRKKTSEMDRMLEEMKARAPATWSSSSVRAFANDDDDDSSSNTAPPPPRKKRREIDAFLEEIKDRGPNDDDAAAPSMAPTSALGAKGSFDNGDPTTTNLYVGNLAPTVTEERLEREFGRFGRVFSIKIMWPRTEEERQRRRNCGFVSFYRRDDADAARVHLHDKELDGQPIVVGWGKAVKIPLHSAPPPTTTSTSPSAVRNASTATKHHAPSEFPEGLPRVRVTIPTDERVRRRIDRLAEYVAKDGKDFEAAVRQRVAGSEHHRREFAFLLEPALAPEEATYYRWRTFALAMGDSPRWWRTAPFQMSPGGPVWLPPPLPHARGKSPTRHAERSHSRSRSSRDNRERSPSRSRDRTDRHHRRRRRSRSYSSHRSSPSRSRSRSRSKGRDHARRSPSRSRSRDHRQCRHRPRSRSPSSGRGRGRPRSEDRHRRRSRSPSSPRERGDPESPHRRRQSSRSPSASPSHRRPRHRPRDRLSPTRDDPVLRKDEKLLTGQQLARARDLERGREPNRLSREDYEAFLGLLDALTLERESIKHAMGFALDKSESAVDLVRILRKEFNRADRSAVALVGFFFVVSDILHNSSAAVKNASLFRTTFQDCLPEVLDRLRRAQQAIGGRMSALAMRDKVLSVLTAWESWSLFPPHYLVGLNATFMRKVEEDEYLRVHHERIERAMRARHGPEGNDGDDDDDERLRKRCQQAGILASGSTRELVARLQWLRDFTAPTPAAGQPLQAAAKDVAVGKTAGHHAPAPVEGTPPTTASPAMLSKHADADDGDSVDGEPMDEDSLDDDRTRAPSARDDEDLDGIPMDDDDDEDADDIDGLPLDEPVAVDGKSSDDVEADEDVDGVPLDDEDVDGESLDDEDEDVDGEPM